jgi:hypothetical protein
MANGTKPSFGQPALIGGVVMGVLSALPLISAGNLCCCLWVLSGGALAAYLLQQNTRVAITPGDGALVGLLAGLVGAVATTIISIPIDIMVGPMQRALAENILNMAGNMPPEMRDMVERVSRRNQAMPFMMIGRAFAFVFWVFVGGIFSTIGGLLGALIFKKDTPPGVIDIPPASPIQ